MSNSSATKLKVGFTTLTALIILFVGVLWVKNYNPAARKLRLAVAFTDGGGITGGDVVHLSGVKVGEVTDVSLGDDNRAIVRFYMNYARLGSDTRFKIEDVGLMGDKAVVIVPGSAQEELDPEAIHQGQEPGGLGVLLSDAGNIMQKLDSISTKIDQDLDVAKLTGDLEKTLVSFREAIDAYRELAEHTREPLASSIQNLESSSQELKEFIDTNDEKITSTIDSFQHTSEKLSAFIDEMDTFSAVVDTVATYLDNDEGTMARFVKSDELYEELRRTNAHIDSFIVDFKNNPGKYTKDMNFKVRLF